MLTEKNQVLTRAEPNGLGGTQIIYRVGNYGITALSPPAEDLSRIHWKVEVIKFRNDHTLQYDVCRDTELADKTLTFQNDKSLNEFLEKAFTYFRELGDLENMLEK